jgi:hypothetical protein
MLLHIVIVHLFACLAPHAWAQDAVHTDSDKYRVILENDCVRVLDYKDLPGEKTHPHRHPDFVLYAGRFQAHADAARRQGAPAPVRGR